jgi:hypothetical protein
LNSRNNSETGKTPQTKRSRKRATHRKQGKQVDGADLAHQNVAKQAAKKQMLKLIKDALDGLYEEKLSTLQTGLCETQYEDARNNMNELIRRINPEELENYAFLKNDDDDEIL